MPKSTKFERTNNSKLKIQNSRVNQSPLKVNISGKTLTILLDQETNLPRVIRYQKFNPRKGGNITVEARYSNWTTKEGVTYPYKQVSYARVKKLPLLFTVLTQ